MSPRSNSDFESAVREELATLYRVAKRMTLREEDAEDLVQQTLVKAFKSWTAFDGAHLRSWLIRILRNERSNFLRAKGSRPEETALVEDHGDDGWAMVDWRDQAHRVLLLLDSFPEQYRVVVQLCDVEEWTYEEVSEALDVPIGTIRSRLHRARRAIRVGLTPDVETMGGVT